MWTSNDVLKLIDELRARGGDKTEVEVKAARDGVPGLGESLSAFGNTPDGGTIILGIDEKADFNIVGVEKVADYEQAVVSQAREAVDPPVQCNFSTVSVKGKKVLVCDVLGLPLSARPARYAGIAYLRQADGDYALSEQEISQIELLKTQSLRRTMPDAEFISDSAIEDLDADLCAKYIAASRVESRRMQLMSDEEILFNTGVTSREGKISLAGLYALGAAPQRINPSLGVTAAVQLDSAQDGARIRDLSHFTGPVPDLLDQSLEWVRRNTHTTMGYDASGKGKDSEELPMIAVREIIANALIHRSLDAVTAGKRVEIRIRKDSLTISSPGGLWGVSEQQLGQPGGKSAVNPTLYEICKRIRMADGSRVIEGEGGGIAEAVKAMRLAGLREPRFIDKGISFTVQLSRHSLLSNSELQYLKDNPHDSDIASEALSVISRLHAGEEWSVPRIRDEFGVSQAEARSILQEVKGAVDVVETKRGRRKTYALPGKVTAPQLDFKVSPKKSDKMTKNGPALLGALDSPATFNELVEATGLSQGQARFALSWLIDHGHVRMRGTQGDRRTVYEKVD